jgi:hypothetical protein
MRRSRMHIEQELRSRINARVYPPGSRLPSRRALQLELGGSPLTVQAAFDHLAAQGYILTHGSRGTFVANPLPDQSTIALVFNNEVEHGSWNRFWSALHSVGVQRRGGGSLVPWVFRAYCLADGRPAGPVYRQLCSDLADGALAGVLFTGPPLFADPSPLFTAPVPRVCISAAPLATRPFAASHLKTTDQPVIDRLVRRFRTNGRKRIAGLASNPDELERVRAMAEAGGLEARREWWHWLPTDAFGAATSRRILHLLGTLPERQRPDCLLITDDNLVLPATTGILDASWRAPHDLEVAAHANFPLTTHAAVPCLRYGMDVPELLRVAAEEIGKLAAGASPRIVQLPFTIPSEAR